jgi:hypothetical protein
MENILAFFLLICGLGTFAVAAYLMAYGTRSGSSL